MTLKFSLRWSYSTPVFALRSPATPPLYLQNRIPKFHSTSAPPSRQNYARRFFFSPETDTRAPAKAAFGWWRLAERGVEEKEESTAAKAKPVTVLRALHRMWNLIEAERWIVFVAFGAMILAAVSWNPETKLFINSMKKWSQ